MRIRALVAMACVLALMGCTGPEPDEATDVVQYDLTQTQSLWAAVARGDTSAAQSLLDAGADVNAQSIGSSLLHIAAEASDAEMVSLLISEGADIEAVRLQRHRPLHIAAAAGDVATVQLLLDAGAQVDSESGGGFGNQVTPLDLAASFGRLDVIEVLHQAGADIAHVTPDGHSAMTSAACNGELSAVRLLADLGAVTAQGEADGDVSPALQCAIENGHTGIAEYLRSHDAAS